MSIPATPIPATPLLTASIPTGPAHPPLRVIHSLAPAQRAPRGWQQALPLDWEFPNGVPAEPPAPRHLRVVGTSPPINQPGQAPHPAPWVARLAPAIFEVIAGERPVTQLTRWVARDILATLARRHAAARRHPAGRERPAQRRVARAVRVHSVAPGIVEASAVVSTTQRSRAIALRLEAVGRESAGGPRWLITACEIG
jgi:hypothetical protein